MQAPPDPTAPSAYLQDAAEALTACGSAPDLYVKLLPIPARARDDAERYVKVREGPNMQARFARNSILFSAFAAEAYVNGFLSERLSKADFEAIDRLSTAEKYAVGVSYAQRAQAFERGSEPAQTLKRLFDARNALAHPKPGKRVTRSVVDPENAAGFLVGAARAALALDDRGDHVADLIASNAAEVIAWGKKWTGRVPPFDAPRPTDLLNGFAKRWLVAQLVVEPDGTQED
jgi:hypothetical protein